VKRPMRTAPLRTLALLGCVVTVGCATPPTLVSTRTTVVLLPDEDGNVGTVSVNTPAGSQILDRAFTAATVDSAASVPSVAPGLGRDRIDAAYRDLLKAQPPKPTTFTLYFLLDKTVLTDDSKALLPAMLEAVRARKPTGIMIFGHADASGTEARNWQLAAERAKVVADLLYKHDPALENIQLQSFGDKVPAVPPKSRAPEPRNRRAELMVI
jgi:peptidoglycan-associated lipoprotein